MDEEIGKKVFQQVMSIWIIPEIKKRREREEIDEKFSVFGAQVIFSLDKGFNDVRLNEQVKAIIRGKATRDIKKGEKVSEKDLENIDNLKLTDEDPNCAHITLLSFKGKWIISFDFRYDKGLAKEHIKASKEFYEGAIDNLKKKRLRPFYENCFASAELSTKAILMLYIDKKYLDNHENKVKQMKKWVDLGNADVKFSNTLNRLSNLRFSARYLSSEDFKSENPKEIISLIEEMIAFAEDSIK